MSELQVETFRARYVIVYRSGRIAPTTVQNLPMTHDDAGSPGRGNGLVAAAREGEDSRDGGGGGVEVVGDGDPLRP